jgi:hypothetical protein
MSPELKPILVVTSHGRLQARVQEVLAYDGFFCELAQASQLIEAADLSDDMDDYQLRRAIAPLVGVDWQRVRHPPNPCFREPVENYLARLADDYAEHTYSEELAMKVAIATRTLQRHPTKWPESWGNICACAECRPSEK